MIESVDIKRRGDVRRAKLYYMRELSGKAARIKEKLTTKGANTKQAKVVEAEITDNNEGDAATSAAE